MQRELVLVKVRADNETRSQILEIVQLFRAKIVDVSPEAVTIEATGNARQAGGAAQGAGALRHQGARPVRHVAIGRGARSITDRALRALDRRPDRAPTGARTARDPPSVP